MTKLSGGPNDGAAGSRRTVLPRELVSNDRWPRALLPVGLELAAILPPGIAHEGPDVSVARFGPLSLLDQHPGGGVLTYLSSRSYARKLGRATGHLVVTAPGLADAVPPGNGVLITRREPKETFCALLERAIELDMFEYLSSHVSATARVAPSAHIDGNVFVDDGAEIGPGSVVLENTYVGKGARLKPGCVVGGDGFETVDRDGNPQVIRHAGGVWLGEGVQVGSGTSVDKAMYGDFTVIGDFTQIDNQAQVGHAARVGRRCILTAGTVLSGWCTLGEGVWLGPLTAVNQFIRIGDWAYVGTGSAVRRDVPSHALVYGPTARQAGWYCVCRTQLVPEEGEVRCENCGRSYTADDGRLREVR